MAHAGLGQPTPWQFFLPDAGSPVMADIIWFHTCVLWFITVITAFVLALLVIITFRSNARANPTPSHYTPIEVIRTIVVPVIILAAVAIPSFRRLFTELDVPTPALTVKATGSSGTGIHLSG